MKDKEKQIEEMAIAEMIQKYLNNNNIKVSNLLLPLHIASILINNNYQKVNEDSIVLSREEFENNLTLYMGYKIGSKETAEKIYLQAKAIVDATKHIVQGREYLHIDALKEIVKSCGVEIKE